MEISNNGFKNNIPSQNFFGTSVSEVDKIRHDSPTDNKVYGQNDCWKLYKPEVFEQFIKSDEELSDILSDTLDLSRQYGFKPSIEMLQKFRKIKPEINDFYEVVKSKYDIDLETPPKVYRFVGKEEIEALKKDGIVKPQRGYWDNFDVTINPDLNWNDYRITFKPKKEFSILDKDSRIKANTGTGHDYFYLYEGPYSADDIEKIETVQK